MAAKKPRRRLWAQGLEASPEGQWAFQQVDEQQAWSVAQGHQPVFEGAPCSVGSKLGTSEYGQTGWAVVEMVGEVTVKVLRGPAPAALPVHRRVKRAEM